MPSDLELVDFQPTLGFRAFFLRAVFYRYS